MVSNFTGNNMIKINGFNFLYKATIPQSLILLSVYVYVFQGIFIDKAHLHLQTKNTTMKSNVFSFQN